MIRQAENNVTEKVYHDHHLSTLLVLGAGIGWLKVQLKDLKGGVYLSS